MKEQLAKPARMHSVTNSFGKEHPVIRTSNFIINVHNIATNSENILFCSNQILLSKLHLVLRFSESKIFAENFISLKNKNNSCCGLYDIGKDCAALAFHCQA